MSQNGNGIGGMRIVTVTVVARAGEPDWSDLKSEVDVNAEPGWPRGVVLAAAVGALKGALAAVEQAQVAESAPGAEGAEQSAEAERGEGS